MGGILNKLSHFITSYLFLGQSQTCMSHRPQLTSLCFTGNRTKHIVHRYTCICTLIHSAVRICFIMDIVNKLLTLPFVV